MNVHRQGARPRLRHTMCYSSWPSAVRPYLAPKPPPSQLPWTLSRASSPGQPHKSRQYTSSCPLHRSGNQHSESLEGVARSSGTPKCSTSSKLPPLVDPQCTHQLPSCAGMRGQRSTTLFMLEVMEHESSTSTAPRDPSSHEPTAVCQPGQGAPMLHRPLVLITLRPVGSGRGCFT